MVYLHLMKYVSNLYKRKQTTSYDYVNFLSTYILRFTIIIEFNMIKLIFYVIIDYSIIWERNNYHCFRSVPMYARAKM